MNIDKRNPAEAGFLCFMGKKSTLLGAFRLSIKFFYLFRKTPGEGFPLFCPLRGKKFTFPALLEAQGISLSADSDQRLLAFGNSVAFL